ncbi:MAG: cyanophycinase [Planctomycetes bacterium]|nr:cyanophycinase [Planctomycetota bacterium]
MRPLLLALFLSISTAPWTAAPQTEATGRGSAPKGWLVAVGGGGTTAAVVARALELAGGPGARMLIVPQASSAEDAGAKSAEFWREHGAREVEVLELSDAARARRQIAAAAFVWMPGGDQNRLMSALREAGLLDAIRGRYQDGAVVGGTSAGAAVLGAVMIVGGDSADLQSVRAGGTVLSAGLGLWEGALVDQHFLKRQRFNRLLAAVLDRPELVGVGVDERTAVVLHPGGDCEVVGDGGVVVVDARRASRRGAEAGQGHSAEGVVLGVHRAGDRFTPMREAPRSQR